MDNTRRAIRRMLTEGIDPDDVDPELEIDGNGYGTFYHETTRKGAEQIIRTKRLSSPHEAAVFFTTRLPDTIAYGDGTVVAFRLPVRWVEIEDEYPDGRQDYRYDFKSMRSARNGVRVSKPEIVRDAEEGAEDVRSWGED